MQLKSATLLNWFREVSDSTYSVQVGSLAASVSTLRQNDLHLWKMRSLVLQLEWSTVDGVRTCRINLNVIWSIQWPLLQDIFD